MWRDAPSFVTSHIAGFVSLRHSLFPHSWVACGGGGGSGFANKENAALACAEPFASGYVRTWYSFTCHVRWCLAGPHYRRNSGPVSGGDHPCPGGDGTRTHTDDNAFRRNPCPHSRSNLGPLQHNRARYRLSVAWAVIP